MCRFFRRAFCCRLLFSGLASRTLSAMSTLPFSPNLCLTNQEGTSSFTLRLNGLITKCEACFYTRCHRYTVANRNFGQTILFRYREPQARNYGACVCQKFLVLSQPSGSLEIWANNHFHHTYCAPQSPHLQCATRSDRGADCSENNAWFVAAKTCVEHTATDGSICGCCPVYV